MADKKKYNSDGRNSEDRALDRFAEMMIEKIKTLQGDWKKPWFTEGALQWPKNLSGREYNGMNALMLMMHCENQGYKLLTVLQGLTIQKTSKAPKHKQQIKMENNYHKCP